MANNTSVSQPRTLRKMAKTAFERDVSRRLNQERWSNRPSDGLEWSCSVNSAGIELRAKAKSPRVRPPDTKRGKIRGFSRESARRLREKLRRYCYDNAVALCLTAPDYTGQSPEDAFKDVGRSLHRYGVSACVWRKEVTRRGRSHYHLVVWPSEGCSADDVRRQLIRAWVNALFVGATLEGLWIAKQKAALCNRLRRGIPKDVWSDDWLQGFEDVFLDNPDITSRLVRQWAQSVADPIALSIDEAFKVGMRDENFRNIETKDGYIRYILDHTSKHKDYQAQTTGRPWGVMGKPPIECDDEYGLSDAQGVLITRVLRKASRYRLHVPCIFGHKRAFGRRFIGTVALGGTHVVFGTDMQKLVVWAREMRP